MKLFKRETLNHHIFLYFYNFTSLIHEGIKELKESMTQTTVVKREEEV